jgi:hypothetical protein
MKSGKSFLCIFLLAIYILFPGDGLAFVNHVFHEKGLPEIDCPCCSENERQSGHPLDEKDDSSNVLDLDCPCLSYLPINSNAFEHCLLTATMQLSEKVHCIPEVYYPIIVPPQNLTV